ncbi:MAG: potassium channel protein [Calditrichales bacterium]|nr:MAG: potassium channel protein [Calditrichales bacterium]
MAKEIRNVLLVVFLLFLGGTIGYYIIEGWSFLDALYMTVITLSTTGFQEIYPLSDTGRILTMILIILGISVLFYALHEINLVIFTGKFFRERKMQKQINQLADHYIICGFGRMGKKISQELDKRNKKFVVIEKEIKNLDPDSDYHYIHGNATEDEDLIRAGIKRARGLVSVLSSDIENTFTTLSARGLNPDLKIIARAEEEASKGKLLKAGADRVVLPYEIGGFRMMQALLKPSVVDYIDEVFSRSDLGLEIEEIKIQETSNLIDKTLAESAIRGTLDIIIIGIYREDGEMIFNPRSETKFHIHDNMIVIGELKKLEKLQVIANGK